MATVIPLARNHFAGSQVGLIENTTHPPVPESTIEDRGRFGSTGEPLSVVPNVSVNHFELDDNVIKALPVPGSKVISSEKYGQSFWGPTAKIVVELPEGGTAAYFLKTFDLQAFGKTMSIGEYESLRVIYEAVPGFCPKPFAHGPYAKDTPEIYFLLMEFREFGKVPAEPGPLGKGLAELHKVSQSPTGKFGFHIKTCYSRIPQEVDHWDESWCAVFKRHLKAFTDHAKVELKWPEFDVVAHCTLEKVVPRLLLPLQEEGRSIKPCLVHGDCWDGNTAMDIETGKAMIFDVCTFYGHNEYDIGNWRAPRHKLSTKPYLKAYKQHYPVAEPREDWDDRNRLYSLPYNIASACYVPGSDQRPVIFNDMQTLCQKFCREYLEEKMRELKGANGAHSQSDSIKNAEKKDGGEDEEEEEEEEEEEALD